MNKIYKYGIQTKEFLEELETTEAYGANLPFTTTLKPLAKRDGVAICFNGTKWEYVEDNRDKMLAIETLNKNSTPEQKIAIIENKISNNKTTLDELFKEKNIEPNSEIGLELLKVYNDTQDELKLELENLKTQVVDIATNDFLER